eukprot:jgi/Hompol1/3634/HPOL_006658-RA
MIASIQPIHSLLGHKTLVSLSYFLCRKLENKRDFNRVGSCLALIGLIPVDVFLVSSTTTKHGIKHTWATPMHVANMISTLESLYYMFFSAYMAVCFAGLPWAYFLIEDMFSFDDLDSSNNTSYLATASSLGVLAVLCIIGAFMGLPPMSPGNLPWMNNLLSQS